MNRELPSKDNGDDDVPAYVEVDPATLLGREGYEKLNRVILIMAGGLGYEGMWKWLAIWPDVDTALREAERYMDGMVAT